MSTPPTPTNPAPAVPPPTDDPVGDDDCALCYEPFSPEHPAAALPNCRHVFGQECIEEWMNSNNTQRNRCPECRAIIEQDVEAEGIMLVAYHDDDIHGIAGATGVFPGGPQDQNAIPAALGVAYDNAGAMTAPVVAPTPAPAAPAAAAAAAANSGYDVSVTFSIDQWPPIQQPVRGPAPAPLVQQQPIQVTAPRPQHVVAPQAHRVQQQAVRAPAPAPAPAPRMQHPAPVQAPHQQQAVRAGAHTAALAPQREQPHWQRDQRDQRPHRPGLRSRIANFFRPHDPLYTSSSRSSRPRDSGHRQTNSSTSHTRTRPSHDEIYTWTTTVERDSRGSYWETHIVEYERNRRGGSSYSFSLGGFQYDHFY